MELKEKFLYLKNVIFQYLIGVHNSEVCGRLVKALQVIVMQALVRVMAAVLDFSPDEERRVVEREVHKRSVWRRSFEQQIPISL